MKATTGHKTTGKSKRLASKRKANRVLPALLTVGVASGLVAGTASAFELGDIRIESSLGQPLRASIPYVLNPTEQLFDFCIHLRSGTVSTGVPIVSRPKIAIADGRIVLTGTTPIMEPMLAMQVSVDCPYTARIAREYMLMMSPAAAFVDSAPQFVEELPPVRPAPVQNTPALNNAPVAMTEPAPAKITPTLPAEPAVDESFVDDQVPTTPVVGQPVTDPIAMSDRYFVQPGDTLSSIARRIDGRAVGVWPAVHSIFAANPEAFADGDVNQLTAAVWLNIPDFSAPGATPDYTAAEDFPASQEFATDEEFASRNPESYSGFEAVSEPVPAEEFTADTVQAEPVEEAVAETMIEPQPEAQPEPAPVAEAVVEPVVEAAVAEPVADNAIVADQATTPVESDQAAEAIDDTAVLRPGDIVAETSAENPTSASTEARPVPVVGRSTTATSDGTGIPKWVLLAGGSALAMLLAFFAFGRTIKERFGSRAVAEPVLPEELHDDELTAENRIVDDVDFQFEDSTVTSQTISLDADLGEGTGLQDSNDLDVAQDFGFSATASGEVEAIVDLELPEEPRTEPVQSPTDIIQPSHRIEEALFAEETIAAEDTQAAPVIEEVQAAPVIEEAEEYDLSMIIDATKQPLGEEELTAKDLMAVRVEESVRAPIIDADADLANQTLASEVDIAILEKDYEDEFTQTQALNEEIAKAAEELALQMHDEDTAEVTARLEVVGDPAMTASVAANVQAGNDDLTEIAGLDAGDDDMTEIASLDADNDELGLLDDTGVNPQVTTRVHNAGNEATVEMPNPGSEKTVEMPNPGNEPTVEMANPGNDPTVEMEIESGKIDTSEPKAS